MGRKIDKGELEAAVRQQLTHVSAVARRSGDLTTAFNEAVAAILDAAGMPNPGSAVRTGGSAPVHFKIPCALDKQHICRIPVACNSICWTPNTRRTTDDPALVTCGRCLKSDYVVMAA